MMGGIPSVLLGLWSVTMASKPKKSQSARIFMLPPELLDIVSGILPFRSRAAFSVCSQGLWRLLGANILRHLKNANGIADKREFLRLLERDLPYYMYCHHCTILHPLLRNDKPMWWRNDNEAVCVRKSGAMRVKWDFYICFHHVQLIMDNYRLGKDYRRPLEQLSRDWRSRYQGDPKTRVWGEICNGELVVRINRTLNSRFHLITPANVQHVATCLYDSICPHQNLDHRFCKRRFGGITHLWCVTHDRELPCGECCSGRKCCQDCLTLYEIKEVQRGDHKIELELDIWKYLGPCKSPWDPQWRQRIDMATLFSREEEARDLRLASYDKTFNVVDSETTEFDCAETGPLLLMGGKWRLQSIQ